jgi:outer membrane receptor protein involved in Fe transport
MKAVKFSPVILLLTLFASNLFAGTTGKIVGTVTDARTGEKLLAANVQVEGLNTGASTNVEGYFVILNVPPGNYRVKASLVGYTATVQTNVRVDIDQTTTLNFKISEESVQGQEVVVVAQRPVVQKDVSASRANIEIQQVEKLPVTTVTGAVGLQAGVQGLSIRGGAINETAVMLDGLSLRDERTNNPFTGINLSAVENLQVQTGGFTAEYGNLRSGVVNIIGKEGGRSAYSLSILGRYSPARPKHFGPSIYDKNSYWIRPYLDDAVAWTGTDNGAWDEWTKAQYAQFLGGWNAVAAASLKDPDPTKHLTPQAAKDLFLFEHRKQAEVKDPDWDFDMGFGGPVPIVSDMLGNLRFFASYRQSNNQYLVPLSETSYREYNGQIKVTGDLTSTMKLTASFLRARTTGTNDNNGGLPGIFSAQADIANLLSQVSYIDSRIFATDYWAPSRVDYTMIGAKISHVISPSTFYDASITYFGSFYNTNPGRERDLTKMYRFGNGYLFDESPYGFSNTPDPPSSPVSTLRYGLGFSNTRDSSEVKSWTGKIDLTSQLDKYNQFKVGAEIVYTDNYVAYAQFDFGLPRNNTYSTWNTFPWRASAYVQDKLEFEGMVANIGLRLDMVDPNGKWYSYANAFDQAFSGSGGLGIDTLLTKEQTKRIVTLSPRLGIAFPISENSKVFFNYGHFRQIPAPENLYLLRRSAFDNSIARLANPGAPVPRTIAYELGYEHSLFDEYLLRFAGYYKDVSNESFLVTYTSRDNSVNYTQYTSNGYRDIRGFEATISKNAGQWVQGFVNYTYDVRTSGYFGAARQYESANQQADYVKTNVYQTKPIPRPFARLNLDLFTPRDFGPEVAGLNLLGDWRVNFIGSWTSGFYFTWVGGGSRPGIENNAQWNDSWNVDMRISKTFTFGKVNFQVFADMSNLFNTKYMSQYGFVDAIDYNSYLSSLHMDGGIDNDLNYINIHGSDKPGDYRKEGVDFQPIVPVQKFSELSLASNQKARPFYFVKETGQYFQYVNNAWQVVDQGKLNQVLDDKAYIDMPNQDTFTFLNPRNIFYGVKLSIEL